MFVYYSSNKIVDVKSNWENSDSKTSCPTLGAPSC